MPFQQPQFYPQMQQMRQPQMPPQFGGGYGSMQPPQRMPQQFGGPQMQNFSGFGGGMPQFGQQFGGQQFGQQRMPQMPQQFGGMGGFGGMPQQINQFGGMQGMPFNQSQFGQQPPMMGGMGGRGQQQMMPPMQQFGGGYGQMQPPQMGRGMQQPQFQPQMPFSPGGMSYGQPQRGSGQSMFSPMPFQANQQQSRAMQPAYQQAAFGRQPQAQQAPPRMPTQKQPQPYSGILPGKQPGVQRQPTQPAPRPPQQTLLPKPIGPPKNSPTKPESTTPKVQSSEFGNWQGNSEPGAWDYLEGMGAGSKNIPGAGGDKPQPTTETNYAELSHMGPDGVTAISNTENAGNIWDENNPNPFNADGSMKDSGYDIYSDPNGPYQQQFNESMMPKSGYVGISDVPGEEGKTINTPPQSLDSIIPMSANGTLLGGDEDATGAQLMQDMGIQPGTWGGTVSNGGQNVTPTSVGGTGRRPRRGQWSGNTWGAAGPTV